MANINKNIIMQAGAAVANATNKAAGLSASTPEPGTIISAIQLVNGGRTIGPDSLAHFTESVRNKLLSLLVSMEPIQDLHGYGHPWPAGGGANKLLLSTSAKSGTVDGVTYSYDPTTEKISLSGTNDNTTIHVLRGFSSNTDGLIVPDFQVGENYTLLVYLPTSMYCQLVYKNGNNEYIPIGYINGTGALSSVTFTIPDDYASFYQFQIYIRGTATSVSGEVYFEIVSGSTAPTSWTPYSNLCPPISRTGLSVYVGPTQDQQDATTYAVDWTSQAGTVYGGTDEVVGGNLESTYGMVDLGTLNWIASSTPNHFYTTEMMPYAFGSDVKMVCSAYKFDGAKGSAPYYGENGTIGCYIRRVDTDSKEIYVHDDRYTSASDFKTAVSGVQLVYELATPLTYQLTPQDIITLVGDNYIWSDSGDVTITE